MATVNFQLKGTNTLKHVYAKLYYKDDTGNKHNYFKNIGKQTTSEEWKKITTKKRSSLTAKSKELKNTLEELEDSILDNFSTDISNNTIIDKEWLQFQIDLFFNKVTKENKISDLLTDNIQYYIDTAHIRPNGKGGIGLSNDRINQYKNLKKIVLEYQVYSRLKYRVKDVDTNFQLNYLSYLSEQEYKTSYQQKLLSNIKTICRDARKNGIEISLKFDDIKIIDVRKEYLTYLDEEEIEKIYKLKISNEALNNARKWILIGSQVGQRGNDLINLTEKNIITKNGRKYFSLTQQKKEKPVNIPFNSLIEKVLEEGFPYRLNISGESGLNKRFKEIGKLAGLDEITEGEVRNKETNNRWVYGKYPKYMLLRTHDLRRTFATNLYGKIPNAIIRAVTGHADDRTLLRYIGKSDIDMATQLADFYEKQELLEQNKSKMTVLKNVANQ